MGPRADVRDRRDPRRGDLPLRAQEREGQVCGERDEGRPLYEDMGFVPTTEMRYSKALR